MPTVADVLRRYGPAYLERYGAAMPPEHKKVLRAISACRTGELGTVLYVCESCGKKHAVACACGNRHCPSCQWKKTDAWLEQQTARLLPCPYFLVTFTVPAGLRGLIRRHQRIAYAALFQASSAALQELATNPRHIGSSRCGFFGVLHTWGRTLEYHPHVHYIVPGGGLNEDGTKWLPSRANFFVPERPLAILFRAKFRHALDRAGLLDQVDPAVWRAKWVVDSQAVGDGQTSLKYLAPYVFRVAISDRRIISCEDDRVTFSYRRVGSKRSRQMTVDAFEFIRRFLQHVLPKGFQKVRHYGFLSPNSKQSIEAVRRLVVFHYGLISLLLANLPQRALAQPEIRCDECGGPLRRLGLFRPAELLYFDTS
jgi:Putative transposase/Transposase zinc-binding domain